MDQPLRNWDKTLLNKLFLRWGFAKGHNQVVDVMVRAEKICNYNINKIECNNRQRSKETNEPPSNGIAVFVIARNN